MIRTYTSEVTIKLLLYDTLIVEISTVYITILNSSCKALFQT